MKIVYASVIALGVVVSASGANAYGQTSNYQENFFGDNVFVNNQSVNREVRKVVKSVHKHYKTTKNVNNYNTYNNTYNTVQAQQVSPQAPQQQTVIDVQTNQYRPQVTNPAPGVIVNINPPAPQPAPQACQVEVHKVDEYGNLVPPHLVKSIGCSIPPQAGGYGY